MAVRPEQIVIGSGAEYLYSLLVQLLGKERVFALENPSYNKIRKVYEANGISCEMLMLGADGIQTSELENTRATVLHITPFNSYPSGVTASVSKRREYLHWAKERCGYIIEDNYDSELTVSKKNEDTVFSLAEENRVIYLNTFSQTIAPSMRIGYMVLPETMVETFEEKLGFTPVRCLFSNSMCWQNCFAAGILNDISTGCVVPEEKHGKLVILKIIKLAILLMPKCDMIA